MKDTIRKSDLLIRWGGEEFLIFLRRTKIEHAILLMENFRLKIQDSPILIDDIPIYVRLTIGVNEHCPRTSIDDSIKKADDLMYQGKLQGRNRVVSEKKSK
jgi:diguanylate cyclase (GGDEF)-like protein